MKIEWIFFDVGSTLVDETLAYDNRAIDMIENTNITFNEFAQKRLELAKLGYDGNSTAIKFFGLEKTPWRTEDEFLYNDAPYVLEKLKSTGYKLGIIANQQAGLEQRLDKWRISKYFDVIVSSYDAGVSKPDKKIFFKAIEKAGAKPQDCLMIGDRLDNDIIPAKEIGMKTIWIKQNLASFQSDMLGDGYADFIVYSLSELCDILIKEI